MVRSVVGVWQIVGAGDQRLQRWECSDRQGTSVLDSKDIDERSRQACTAPAEECQASANTSAPTTKRRYIKCMHLYLYL